MAAFLSSLGLVTTTTITTVHTITLSHNENMWHTVVQDEQTVGFFFPPFMSELETTCGETPPRPRSRSIQLRAVKRSHTHTQDEQRKTCLTSWDLTCDISLSLRIRIRRNRIGAKWKRAQEHMLPCPTQTHQDLPRPSSY